MPYFVYILTSYLMSHSPLDSSTWTSHKCLKGTMARIQFSIFPLKPMPSPMPLVFTISVNATLFSQLQQPKHRNYSQLFPFPQYKSNSPANPTTSLSKADLKSTPLITANDSLTRSVPEPPPWFLSALPLYSTTHFPKSRFLKIKIKSRYTPVQHSSVASHRTRNKPQLLKEIWVVPLSCWTH